MAEITFQAGWIETDLGLIPVDSIRRISYEPRLVTIHDSSGVEHRFLLREGEQAAYVARSLAYDVWGRDFELNAHLA